MKKTIFFFILINVNFLIAQVGINTSNPHVSAELDIESNSKGLLIPRLTTTAINNLSTTASEGLIVFNTTTKNFLGFDGTNWQVLGNLPIQITLASWEVSGFTSGGLSPLSATVTNQITSAVLERGAGLNSGAAANVWGGNNFNNTDLTSAIAGGDFLTITINLPSNNYFSFIEIASTNMRRSPTGPPFFQWQYSTDSSTFSNIGSVINLSDDTANGNSIPEISLSAITGLQNVTNTTITFRLVGFGGTGGTGYFNDIPGKDLEIIGSYR